MKELLGEEKNKTLNDFLYKYIETINFPFKIGKIYLYLNSFN
jgi:hypothetical protein